MGTLALVVPFREALEHVEPFVKGLEMQSVKPDHVFALDSSSNSLTAAALRKVGIEVVPIASHNFDHGGTRNLGLKLALREGSEFVIFMTQDAYMTSSTSVESLLGAFSRESVGAAFGRQVARPDASVLTRRERARRYPSVSYDAADLMPPERYHLSNSFAAYRADALEQVGGFAEPSLFGEDLVASYDLQTAGWRVSYVAEACVEHSHSYSTAQEFRRMFDAGLASRSSRFPPGWGSFRHVVSQGLSRPKDVETVESTAPAALLGRAAISAAARLAGITLGRHAGPWMSTGLGSRFSHSPQALQRCRVLSPRWPRA